MRNLHLPAGKERDPTKELADVLLSTRESQSRPGTKMLVFPEPCFKN